MLGKNRASQHYLIFDEQFSRSAFLEVLMKMKAHCHVGIIRMAKRQKGKILRFYYNVCIILKKKPENLQNTVYNVYPATMNN